MWTASSDEGCTNLQGTQGRSRWSMCHVRRTGATLTRAGAAAARAASRLIGRASAAGHPAMAVAASRAPPSGARAATRLTCLIRLLRPRTCLGADASSILSGMLLPRYPACATQKCLNARRQQTILAPRFIFYFLGGAFPCVQSVAAKGRYPIASHLCGCLSAAAIEEARKGMMRLTYRDEHPAERTPIAAEQG